MPDHKAQAQGDADEKAVEEKLQAEKLAAAAPVESDKQRRARIGLQIAQLNSDKADIDVRIKNLRAQLAK